jgi:hypothetical protein
MPNVWNTLVLEMGVEQQVLPTVSWNNVDLNGIYVGNVVYSSLKLKLFTTIPELTGCCLSLGPPCAYDRTQWAWA